MAGSRGRRSPEQDAAFRQAVDEAKQRFNISDIAGRTRKLRRAGRCEFVALCAFHNERSPSMRLNDAKGTFHCFGCGASGDLVKFVMETERLGFLEAMRWLGAAELPAADPGQRAKVAAEDEADRRRAIADARLMWSQCVDPAGTAAEMYLREVRGITLPFPAAVRFGVVPTSRDDAGNWKRPYPAAVFACTDGSGEVIGLQRVFLRDDGRGKRWDKRSKLSLGRPRGAAVRLVDADPAEILICEGPEDGLTLAQEMPGRSVWVALGTAMMPEIAYPASVTSVVIARQNDEPARIAAAAAQAALVERGKAVRIIHPSDGFKDWNDELRGIRA